jgi:hypothetical protein
MKYYQFMKRIAGGSISFAQAANKNNTATSTTSSGNSKDCLAIAANLYYYGYNNNNILAVGSRAIINVLLQMLF